MHSGQHAGAATGTARPLDYRLFRTASARSAHAAPDAHPSRSSACFTIGVQGTGTSLAHTCIGTRCKHSNALLDMNTAIVSNYLPGALGRITELHASFYHRHAGFGLHFESKVACELAEFLRRYDDKRDHLWLAVADGQIEGSIVIDGIHAHTKGAHLRWFILSERLRGSGMGNALVSLAVEFCRTRHYRDTYLWTFEGLHAARHLYEKNGFRLVAQQPGAQWGQLVNEQRFELSLPTAV